MGLPESELTDEPTEQKPDYTGSIARKGEQQFACILRQRSGVSAGEIDFGLRDCTILVDSEKQDICDVAFALYQSICRETGKRAAKDGSVNADLLCVAVELLADVERYLGPTISGGKMTKARNVIEKAGG